MNLLGSWIDADAVSGIARELTGEEPPAAAPDPSPATRLVEENFDEQQSPPAAEEEQDRTGPERERMRGFLQHVRKRAESSGLIPRTPAPAPDTGSATPEAETRTGFQPPDASLAARVHSLLDWVRATVPARSARVIDAQGCPAAGSDMSPLPAGPEGSGIPCIIDAGTTAGRYSLVVHLPEPPQPAVTALLREALKRAVEPLSPPARPSVRERW